MANISSSSASLSRHHQRAIEAFSHATLEIINDFRGDDHDNAASPQELQRFRAYYHDSSGRARVRLRVRLGIKKEDDAGADGLEALLNCGCIKPFPTDYKEVRSINDGTVQKTTTAEMNNDNESTLPDLKTSDLTTFAFECTTTNNNSSVEITEENKTKSTTVKWTLEGVKILQSIVERSSSSSSDTKTKIISGIIFDIEVSVRGNGPIKTMSTNNTNKTAIGSRNPRSGRPQEIPEDGELYLRAILRQRRQVDDNRGSKKGGENSESSDKSTAALRSLLHGSSGGDIATRILRSEFVGIGSSHRSTHHNNHRTNNFDYGSSSSSSSVLHHGTHTIHTPQLPLHVTLVSPLRLHIREVCGARGASGSTLVEVTIEHPTDVHDASVTVTGISFHPGQSRLREDDDAPGANEYEVSVVAVDDDYDDNENDDNDTSTAPPPSTTTIAPPTTTTTNTEGKSIQGGELSVIDMSRRVRWGYIPGTAPQLPLILNPYEAFATVIQIDAGEDVRSRAFLSPISVTATIAGPNNKKDIEVGTTTNDNAVNDENEGERIMVAADARWTSSRVGVENSDAFRIDMSLRGDPTSWRVGAPLVVSLRVLNLSMEPRDLMLIMAKDGEGTDSTASGLRYGDQQQTKKAGGDNVKMLHQPSKAIRRPSKKENHRFNTAVVSEVNGYTFGVWGLTGDDDGTTRHHRDHELLAVDAALLLGEVKGQHSIETELRFVPLKEGTLDVPNLKLYDKRGKKWYNANHTLKIVAKEGKSSSTI